MMKANGKEVYEETKRIHDLCAYLKNTDKDEIIVRTNYVDGGWYDNEFDAHYAGFNICRFINPEMEERHEFSMCYDLTRMPA